ncbi:MAG TPA: C-terminal binding protein [Gemmataceae bacterium]|jgi:D-3-phosphoglycerate dehydrogenase/C-terminal binding protein|nr:C-terminal binding protein [Gemmataceae bacterium]
MSQRFRVVITDFITDDLGPERKLLGDIADLVALDAFSEDDLRGRVEEADALMIYHNIGISKGTIDSLKHCKLIVRCGVGYDNVDRLYARTKGIPVANVPDYGTEEVADSAIGLTLTLTRGIHLLNSIYRENPEGWTYRSAVPILRLRGRVFGVIGLGRIGSAAAVRAKALGMDVIFYDPLKPDGYDKALGIRRVDTLDELLRQAFVVSVHTPLTPDTNKMIDAAAIAKTPRGSYLVNTARGAVVDTSAIPDAIASGHLAGAGIDVLAIEPPPADDPLIHAWRDPKHLAFHRVIVNPHSAFYAEEGLLDMRTKGSKAVQNALLGRPLLNIVN